MEEFELEPREIVVTEVRQHLFVLFTKIFPLFLLFFVPLVFQALFSFVGSAVPGISGFSGGYVLHFLTGLWWLVLWTSIFSTFTRFYLTVWVITNLRIVDIKQFSFFNRQVSSFLLVRVQDITTNVSGMLGTLIGFGSLEVETAGNAEKFSMDGLTNPEGIRDVIMSQVAMLHSDNAPLSGV